MKIIRNPLRKLAKKRRSNAPDGAKIKTKFARNTRNIERKKKTNSGFQYFLMTNTITPAMEPNMVAI